MIELEASWQQVTQALEHEDFEAAYAVLDGAMTGATRSQQARLMLYAASLHSLYGDSGVADLEGALQEAARLDAKVQGDALYLALQAELRARQQAESAPAPPPAALAGDALGRYHAMSALALSGRAQEAVEAAPPASELPPHLRWRLRSWQADSEEALGHLDDAAHLYAEAAHLTEGLNRAIMLQEQAAVLISQERQAEAEDILARARREYGPQAETEEGEGLHLAGWYYLQAQVELALDRADEALASVQAADRLERAHGDPSYGVALVWGQVLSHQGRQEEAVAHFEEALRRAGPKDRPYALHELGVAYLDLDRPVEARERLQEALGALDYPFAPEVHADLAESEYRLGRLSEAEASAQHALSQGAAVPASLVLGSVALDYYHLEEALEHYERVVREAAPGSRDWITGHQMAADVMAQLGFPDPGAAYAHAQTALEYTDPSDEWHATLHEHLDRAQAQLQTGRNRTLN